jgi:hypothetical protein
MIVDLLVVAQLLVAAAPGGEAAPQGEAAAQRAGEVAAAEAEVTPATAAPREGAAVGSPGHDVWSLHLAAARHRRDEPGPLTFAESTAGGSSP